MNIYLIGMMGSGKTVTGKALAELHGAVFVDLDQELEKKYGMTIAKIFEKEGEISFRIREKIILGQFSKQGKQVISTGGGIILDPQNIATMKKFGRVIYLETSLEWLWKRVKDKGHRPLLKSKDPKAALEGILNLRKSIYESAADFKVVTDGKTAEEVAQEIQKKIGLSS